MRGFFKRLLGGSGESVDEAEQLCDVATGNWAPVPISAAGQQTDWVGWLDQDELDELLEFEDEFEDEDGDEALDDASAVQRLAARTLAAHRAAATTVQRCEPREPRTTVPPVLTLAPLTQAPPLSTEQQRQAAPPQTGLAAQPQTTGLAAQPQTGLVAQKAAQKPVPPSHLDAPSHLDYLSPEERAIVEAQRSPAAAAGPPEAAAPSVPSRKPRPAPPTTRPRFATSPVSTCARKSGAARPSQPRMRAVTGRTLRPVSRIKGPARAPGASDSGEWTDMVRAYGEHLTDEELLIIRSQLS